MSDKLRVLILCTGNSARSQMAEGLLRHDGGERFEVESAGTKASFVRPEAITVMREVGIDISGHRSKNVGEFDGQDFDYVITVCDNARETCPVFFGKAHKLHHDFEDPAGAKGSEEERLAVFRRVRDELRRYLREFNNIVPTSLEAAFAREASRRQKADHERAELQDAVNRAFLQELEDRQRQREIERQSVESGQTGASAKTDSMPESAPRQEDRKEFPTHRGVKRDERTQFILDRWAKGERNRETLKRAFLLRFPLPKRQKPDVVFAQWWENAAKHCPEMRRSGQSRTA